MKINTNSDLILKFKDSLEEKEVGGMHNEINIGLPAAVPKNQT